MLPKVGASPSGIQNYLRQQGALSSYRIDQNPSKTFAVQRELMANSLDAAHPLMVLVMNTGQSLHWVNIVGHDHHTGDWIYLDTDGEIYALTGGDDELEHWMDMGGCLVQQMGFVDRFNTLTALNPAS